MSGHEERSHALLGPSKAYQWTACTPSARLEEGFPDSSSEAAKEGTLAHELAELKLRNYFYSVEFGKRKLNAAINKLKKENPDLWQEEMMGYTDEYLEFVRSVALALPSAPHPDIERHVDLSAYIPGGFGTADCILIQGDLIHVIDFKYGKSPTGRVEAAHNPQMQLYALGAYELYKMLYPVKRIRLSIVQPRLADGITTWETTLEELLAFGGNVKEKAALAMEGKGEFAPSEKTCRYCRAAGRCRARAEENVRLAFADGYQKKPPLISNEEMGGYLRQGTDIAKWLSDLEDIALKECLAGNEIPGWKAVEGRGSRAWADLDKAFAHLQKAGIPEAMLWERKPVTSPALEKSLGKKEYAARTEGYVIKKAGKPALVPASDSRPAITNKVTAEEAFKGEANDYSKSERPAQA